MASTSAQAGGEAAPSAAGAEAVPSAAGAEAAPSAAVSEAAPSAVRVETSEGHRVKSVAADSSAPRVVPVTKCPTRRFGSTELAMPILSCGGMRHDSLPTASSTR